jgi:hypothetical protein
MPSNTFALGAGVPCDLNTLIDTRALVQANSGGGKSWLLRRLLEQTHGRVQHLVIDPEGEFASLRERFDYVLAARHGGDTAADPRSAKLLAERLLELGVSAILDIYELKAHDRIRFVRFFLEALVDAPKKLWHPALVVVDEAHVFCPQQGEAESANAVIDLATRGRKRGFCAALATQRLSKLHKDAAAELNNKLIGRTGLDVDVKRAADELGFAKERWRDLRELDAGAFFAFGPALSREVRAVTIGPVQTTHPKAGARLAFTAPPPTAKVKALLPKLADLPAEAEERQRTLQDLQRELAETKRALAAAQRATAPAPKERRIEVKVLPEPLVRRLEAAVRRLPAREGRLGQAVEHLVAGLERAISAATVITARLEEARRPAQVPVVPLRAATPAAPPRPTVAHGPGDADVGGGGLRRILIALAQRPQGLTLRQIGVRAGLSSRSGTFSTYMSRARQRGWIRDGGPGGASTITDAGVQALGTYEPLPTGRELLAYWLRELGESGAARILRAVADAYPEALSLEAIGARADLNPRSGTFSTYLSRLRTLELIEGRGMVTASKELCG